MLGLELAFLPAARFTRSIELIESRSIKPPRFRRHGPGHLKEQRRKQQQKTDDPLHMAPLYGSASYAVVGEVV